MFRAVGLQRNGRASHDDGLALTPGGIGECAFSGDDFLLFQFRKKRKLTGQPEESPVPGRVPAWTGEEPVEISQGQE